MLRDLVSTAAPAAALQAGSIPKHRREDGYLPTESAALGGWLSGWVFRHLLCTRQEESSLRSPGAGASPRSRCSLARARLRPGRLRHQPRHGADARASCGLRKWAMGRMLMGFALVQQPFWGQDKHWLLSSECVAAWIPWACFPGLTKSKLDSHL